MADSTPAETTMLMPPLVISRRTRSSPRQAECQSAELRAAGDDAGALAWGQIFDAIDELRRTAPDPGESTH